MCIGMSKLVDVRSMYRIIDPKIISNESRQKMVAHCAKRGLNNNSLKKRVSIHDEIEINWNYNGY